MNGFPAQGAPMQPDPQNWGQLYGAPNTPFNRVQQPRISAIPGRMVQSEQDIKPNDVPMDGSVALFPVGDMSCVFAKAWNSNGQILTVRYVPDQPQQADQISQKDPFQSMVESRLSSIEETLQKLLPTEKAKNKPKGDDGK